LKPLLVAIPNARSRIQSRVERPISPILPILPR
jgi:hypothetical protein